MRQSPEQEAANLREQREAEADKPNRLPIRVMFHRSIAAVANGNGMVGPKSAN